MNQNHIVLVILEFLLFQLKRILNNCVETIKGYFNGTLAKINAAKDPKNYACSARIASISGWILFDPWMAHSSHHNFITCHERFVHPEYVLKDEVSLYCFTEDEAWFVEAPSGIEVWRSECSAFHKIAQHEFSEKIIKMPLSSLYQLADGLGKIKETLIFIEFVPRSGSTLLGQIFEETGVCVNYSEPHFLNMFWEEEKDNTEEHVKKLTAALRMYCKPRSKPTTAFVFKTAPLLKSLVPILYQIHPESKFIYLVRNAIPNVRSLYKTSNKTNLSRLIRFISQSRTMGKIIIRKQIQRANWLWDDTIQKLFDKSSDPVTLSLYHIYIRLHILHMARLNDKPDILTVKYEDFLSNKEANIAIMFKHCGLDLSLIPDALAAFHKDSQSGSILSKTSMGKFNDGGLTNSSEMLDSARQLGQHLGFDDLFGDIRLPGTATTP